MSQSPSSNPEFHKSDTMNDAELTQLALEILEDIEPHRLSTMVNIDSTDDFILQLAEEYNNDCKTSVGCPSPPSLYDQALTFSQLPSLPHQKSQSYPFISMHSNILHSKSPIDLLHVPLHTLDSATSEPVLHQRHNIKPKVSVIPDFSSNKSKRRNTERHPKKSKSNTFKKRKKVKNKLRSSSAHAHYEYAVETEYGMEFVSVNASEYSAMCGKY